MADTLKRLAVEHGDSYLVLDPDYDVSKQVNQMLDVANKGVNLAFLIPVDLGGVHAGLQALKDAGIPVINIDTAVVADDVAGQVGCGYRRLYGRQARRRADG